MKANYFRYALATISISAFGTAICDLIVNNILGFTFSEFISISILGILLYGLLSVIYIEEMLSDENSLRKWIYSGRK